MHFSDISLIGIHGPLNGGKDTIGNYILAKHPDRFRRYAFAQPLKNALQALFDFTPQQIEDRVLKEKVDEFWGFSPRYAIQRLGTEYGRAMMRDDVWIKRAELEHKNNRESGIGTVITDVRFENEAQWIRAQPNSMLIYIEVPGLVKDARYKHASEAGITMMPGDVHIINDKTKGLKYLFAQLDVVLFS